MNKLYDADFVEWTRESAALLRSRDFADADIDHIAEEIEDLGKSWRRSLDSRMTQLVMHLLKLDRQPDQTSHIRSWRGSVVNQRIEINKLIRDAPSLRREMAPALAANYADAVKMAAAETGLEPTAFPKQCPWTLEQVLDENFWPR